MPETTDPTTALRETAGSYSGVAAGTACTQASFKTGTRSFLFVGPGAKGIGFKAMFKLDASMEEARLLAAEAPDRFDVGTTGWVTARFSASDPLPRAIWERWLRESYVLSGGAA